MKNRHQHNQFAIKGNDDRALPGIEIGYSRSKEDVWSLIQTDMERHIRTTPKIYRHSSNRLLMVAASLLVLFVSSTIFGFIYTKTTHAPAGQHLSLLLPDGSEMQLNAQSKASYKPLWWIFNRSITLEGEAYFNVRKGKRFEVISSKGHTRVLGTSFNVFARGNDYKVTCYSGKVKVVSVVSGQWVDVLPNQQAIISANGKVVLQNEKEARQAKSWMSDRFIFTQTPIKMVFEEVERQYNISIETEENLDYLYTGHFTRDREAQEVIRMICLALNLDYRPTDGGFIISKVADP